MNDLKIKLTKQLHCNRTKKNKISGNTFNKNVKGVFIEVYKILLRQTEVGPKSMKGCTCSQIGRLHLARMAVLRLIYRFTLIPPKIWTSLFCTNWQANSKTYTVMQRTQPRSRRAFPVNSRTVAVSVFTVHTVSRNHSFYHCRSWTGMAVAINLCLQRQAPTRNRLNSTILQKKNPILFFCKTVWLTPTFAYELQSSSNEGSVVLA